VEDRKRVTHSKSNVAHTCVTVAAIAGLILCARSLRRTLQTVEAEVSAMRTDFTDVLTIADADAELRQRRNGTYVGADVTPLVPAVRSGPPGRPAERPAAPAQPAPTGHTGEASPPRTNRTVPSRRPRNRRRQPTGARRGAAAYEG